MDHELEYMSSTTNELTECHLYVVVSPMYMDFINDLLYDDLTYYYVLS